MSTRPSKRIVVAGGSGFIGSALVAAWHEAGHSVLRLVRRRPQAPDEVFWNPAAGEIDAAGLVGIDAVVNLAGGNIAGGRWTRARRELILRSRIEATHTLVTAIARLDRKPAVLVSASAVGFYGSRSDEILTEASGPGKGFLPDVCRAWESRAMEAERSGVRVVCLRLGVVLDREGGALRKMLPAFRLGLGGRLGAGRQWMSWIALADAVAAFAHAIEQERCAGPMNLVAPEPVTNAVFTQTLARILRRPAIMPVPGFALRLAFGRMADEALLASARAVPDRLRETGFVFRHPTLEPALLAMLPR